MHYAKWSVRLFDYSQIFEAELPHFCNCYSFWKSALHFRRYVFIWKSIGTFRFKCSSPLQRWRPANEIKFQSCWNNSVILWNFNWTGGKRNRNDKAENFHHIASRKQKKHWNFSFDEINSIVEYKEFAELGRARKEQRKPVCETHLTAKLTNRFNDFVCVFNIAPFDLGSVVSKFMPGFQRYADIDSKSGAKFYGPTTPREITRPLKVPHVFARRDDELPFRFLSRKSTDSISCLSLPLSLFI